jgi:hypothetical protein
VVSLTRSLPSCPAREVDAEEVGGAELKRSTMGHWRLVVLRQVGLTPLTVLTAGATGQDPSHENRDLLCAW